MPLLLDLPPEIVTLILEAVGPKALRADVGLLSICRPWYHLAHPVFLSHLDTSFLRLSARSLERFPPAQSPLQEHLCATAKRLAVRLLGHPWDSLGGRWEEDQADSEFGFAGDSDAGDRDAGVVPADEDDQNVPPPWYYLPKRNRRLKLWRETINARIEDLADAIARSPHLDAVRFEASAETDEAIGPCWNYLRNRSVARLLSGLETQTSLSSLTLDTCGSALLPSRGGGGGDGEEAVHLCPLVARCLPNIRRVRLRMRHMCPAIFGAGSFPRLEGLTVKLHQPMFPGTDHRSDGGGGLCYWTRPCAAAGGTDYGPPRDLHRHMVKAARAAIPRMPALRSLVISFLAPHGRAPIVLGAVDCLAGTVTSPGHQAFCYEDDGTPWWWEELPLVAGRPYDPQ